MSIETVARRYAIALADVVSKNGDVETVRSELKSWEDLINSSTELQAAFGNPSIPHPNKVGVLEGLLQRAKPSKTTSNFLRVLLRNNRLTELGEINERFRSELEERSGVVSAHVTSARELSDAEKTELQASLAKLTGKQVKLNFNIDKNIIGGVVTRVGSTVYDGSVRTQLQNLKEQMIGS
jgi:F-type H+-transporting ATPase subunit delta